MEIRPAIRADLDRLGDIDATVESSDYLHVERTGEGLAMSVKIEPRRLREKLIQANRINDELAFSLRQIAERIDEGVALVGEHDGTIVAVAIAQSRPEFDTVQVLDVRVDYDLRRHGVATAMLFQIIQHARDRGRRAVFAEASANNLPANQLLLKCGFELSGLDLRRRSNHDLIKESATLLWYGALDS